MLGLARVSFPRAGPGLRGLAIWGVRKTAERRHYSTMTDEEKTQRLEQIRAAERARYPDLPEEEIEKFASALFGIETMPPRVPEVEHEPASSLPVDEAVRRINVKLKKCDCGNEWPQELVKAENETQESWYGEYRLEEWNPDPPDDEESPKRPDIIERSVDVERLAHKLGVLTPDGRVLYGDERDNELADED